MHTPAPAFRLPSKQPSGMGSRDALELSTANLRPSQNQSRADLAARPSRLAPPPLKPLPAKGGLHTPRPTPVQQCHKISRALLHLPHPRRAEGRQLRGLQEPVHAPLPRGCFTWCRRVSVPLAKPGPASCGETRTRSSWAETWRRSSSRARVSFSNCASCSLTEARMLAVDSTSESSMGDGCPGWAGRGARGGTSRGGLVSR